MKNTFKIFFTILFLVSGIQLHAAECNSKAEGYAREAMKKDCSVKSCKTKEIDQITDPASLKSYGVKADEAVYLASISIGTSNRIFQTIIKKADCKKVSVNEIGSSDDD